MTPHLQPELWSHVLFFLKRPTPKAYERGDWRDLHQHDLVTVSLVSSSIIVNRLPHLLQHTTDAPATLHDKITPKLDRLKLVRHLRLCALGPPLHSRWNVHDLLEHADFSPVGESEDEQHARWLRQGLDECAEFTAFFITTPAEQLPQLRLDSLTIGQAGQRMWQVISQEHGARDLVDYLNTSCSQYANYVTSLGSRHICSYQSFGPYMLPGGLHLGEALRPTFNVHHWDNDVYQPLYLGARNRHFFERGHNSDGVDNIAVRLIYGIGEPPGEGHLLELREVLNMHTKMSSTELNELVPKTDLEVYGLFASGVGRDTEGETTDTDEDFLMSEITPRWLASLENDWRQRVEFYKWDETPCCEACGSDPRVHDFEWALIPQEVLARVRGFCT